MIDIIQFNPSDFQAFNEIFNVSFTVFLYAVPVKLIGYILDKASKWF
jgi:hypothetical protein